MRPKMMRRGKNDDNEEAGKMFVGGLSWETTQDSMLTYFSRWGEVVDCVVMKNSETGRSRGFGFVTFAEPENVARVLGEGPHELDGRTIDPKACNPRSLQNKLRLRSQVYPKVFLGGLPPSVTETDLRNFFGQFGHVMEVVIMYDQEKRKSRGFGFLSFESEDAVERVLSKHFVNIGGKQVEVKLAEPREANKQEGQSMMLGGGGDVWRPPPHTQPTANAAHWGMPGMPVRPREQPQHWGVQHQQLGTGAPGVAAAGVQVMQWSPPQPYPAQQQFAPPPQQPQPQPQQLQQLPAGWTPAPPQPAGWAAYGQPPPHATHYSAGPFAAAPQPASATWPPQPLPPSGGPSPMPGADPYGRVLQPQKQADFTHWQQQLGMAAEYAQARQVAPPPQHQEMAQSVPQQIQGFVNYNAPPMADGLGYAQPAGPGPQRGGNYTQPTQAQLYHPYRHSPYPARR